MKTNGIILKSKYNNYTPFIINFTFILLSLYIFFGYLIPKYYSYALLVIILSLFTYTLISNWDYTPKNNLLTIFIVSFILISLLPAPFTLFPDTSIKASINRSVILMIGLVMSFQGDMFKKGLKYLFTAAIIHVVFTYISFIFPDLFTLILSFFPAKVIEASQWFLSRNLYAGITEQTGQNSFYISIAFAFVYSSLLTSKKSTRSARLFLLLLIFLALLLTGRRGSIGAVIIASLVTAIMHRATVTKISLLVLVRYITILIGITSFFIIMLPDSNTIFRNMFYFGRSDFFSGRLKLYEYAVKMFFDKPIFGWGVGVFASKYSMGVHSLYIQLLAEHGLIGFLNFMGIIAINFNITIKTMKRDCQLNQHKIDKYYLFALFIQTFFVIYGLVENPINDSFVLIVYLIASAIPYVSYRSNIKYNSK